MEQNLIGSTVTVAFAQMGKSLEGKVDTGATTSSLHAEDIRLNGNKSVSFRCPALSNNTLTLPLDGAQEVHSADGGGVTRPMVNLDITINGTPIENVTFNLNDRSNMDSPLLIGQNALQSGNFIIDPKKDNKQPVEANMTDRETTIGEAVSVLLSHNVSLQELINYMTIQQPSNHDN